MREEKKEEKKLRKIERKQRIEREWKIMDRNYK